MYFSANECELAWSQMTRFASYPFSMFFFFKRLLINTLIKATNHLKISEKKKCAVSIIIKELLDFWPLQISISWTSTPQKTAGSSSSRERAFHNSNTTNLNKTIFAGNAGRDSWWNHDFWENRAQNVVHIVYSVFYSVLFKCAQITDGNTTQVYFKECDTR